MARPKKETTGETASKTIQNVKNSLKYSAQEKSGALTVRLGVKKFVLPLSARLIAGDGYLFLSFPASSEIYAVEGKTLTPVEDDAKAEEVRAALTVEKKARGRRKRKGAELDPNLAEMLAKLPAGQRIGYNADGSPKIVKSRPRKAKKGDDAE